MAPELEIALHAHCQALRGLARALVGDEHADDLLQDTALQALLGGAGGGGAAARAPRAWLATVLRFLASKHRRGQRRRARREREAARPEAVPPADREVETGDSLRRLVEHVLALPQPYRDVVLQRFLRERTPMQIAAQSGVPLATVKSRLQRGLALLRDRLDGDGGDWRFALCAAVGIERALPPAAAGAAFATTGAVLMGTAAKLTFASAAAALAVAAWLLLGNDADAPAAPRAPSDTRQTAAAAAPLEPAAATLAHDRAAREPVDAARSVASVPAGSPAGARLRGRCVDAHGLPVAGVTAAVAGYRLQRAADPPGVHGAFAAEPVVTGADGVFAVAFELPPSSYLSLELRDAGIATVYASWSDLRPDARIDVGNVVVEPGVRVRGIVVDATGAPVRRALVSLRRAGAANGTSDANGGAAVVGSLQTLAERDGAFAFEPLFAPGAWTVEAGNGKDTVTQAMHFEVPAMDLRLVLPALDPRAVLTGTVVDEAGGPVAGALVECADAKRGCRTDPEGWFRLHRGEDAPERGGARVRVQHGGYQETVADALEWGTHDVRLVLRPLASQTVRVVGPDGAPVEEYDVLVAQQPRRGIGIEPWQCGLRASGRHADGVARLGLEPGSWLLLVRPSNDALATSDVVPFAVPADGRANTVVALEANATWSIRVESAAHAPMAGSSVRVCVAPATGGFAFPEPVRAEDWCTHPSRDRVLRLLDDGTTDARGEAPVRAPRRARCRLLVSGPLHAPCSVDLDLATLDPSQPIAIPVAVGARVHGRCGPPEALAEVRAMATANADGDGELPAMELLPADPAVTARPVGAIAADGSYALEHVPPGRWRLGVRVRLAMEGFVMGTAFTIAPELELRDGAAVAIDADLTPLRFGRFDLRVLHNDEPLADAQVVPILVQRGPFSLQSSTRTTADGRLRCARVHGSYRLEWNVSGRDGGDRVRSVETVLLRPGAVATGTIHFRTGLLRVRVVDAGGAPVRGVAVALHDALGEPRHTLPATAADGTAELRVEAETFSCHVGDAQVGTATVPAGGTADLALRLPR